MIAGRRPRSRRYKRPSAVRQDVRERRAYAAQLVVQRRNLRCFLDLRRVAIPNLVGLLERPALRGDHDGRAEQARDGGETGMAQKPPPVSFSVGSRRHAFLLFETRGRGESPARRSHSNEEFEAVRGFRWSRPPAGSRDRGRRLRGLVRTQLCWDRLTWTVLERWTESGWLGHEGTRWLRTSPRPKSLRAWLPLVRLQPGERARFLWRGLIPA